MPKQQLVDYINQEIEKGVDAKTLTEKLLKAGWAQQDINDALVQIKQELQQASTPPVQPQTNPRIYPVISIELPQNPSRFYAIPILGMLIKIIMLIPVFSVAMLLFYFNLIILMINSFSVLFTGKYWNYAYRLNLGFIRWGTKAGFFLFGLTDKYPGSSFNINDSFSVDIAYPEHPNRLFAVPFLGFFIRYLLMLPFLIYSGIIGQAAYLGMGFSWLTVLFSKKYPESNFELAKDALRLGYSPFVYTAGLSDTYPSFRISMNHKIMKLLLIGLVTVIFILNIVTGIMSAKTSSKLESAKPGKPDMVQLSQKAGFAVVTPKTLPKGFVYEGYGIKSEEKFKSKQAVITSTRSKGEEIDIIEYLPKGTFDQTDFLLRWAKTYFPQYFPKEIQVASYKGYLLGKPSQINKKVKEKEIGWYDGKRAIIITVFPYSALADQELISFANSFYNEQKPELTPSTPISETNTSKQNCGTVDPTHILQTPLQEWSSTEKSSLSCINQAYISCIPATIEFSSSKGESYEIQKIDNQNCVISQKTSNPISLTTCKIPLDYIASAKLRAEKVGAQDFFFVDNIMVVFFNTNIIPLTNTETGQTIRLECQ